MENAIEVRNLCKSYGDFSLKNVNITVPRGSIMGFVGENGAGKTTTIKLMLNLINKDSGSVKLLGLDAAKDEVAAKQEIGVVLDGSFFHELFTPKEIARIMAKMYGNWDGALFDGYLKQFSLPEKKAVKAFSKGMKMKLSIAAALSHHPSLLIMDEATSGLDPIVRSEILDIFQDFIQDENHAVFLSSHITSDLEKVADYITFLHQGAVVFSEPKDELKENFGILKCGAADFSRIDSSDIAGSRKNQFGCEVLVKDKQRARRKYANFIIDDASIEDIMLFYVRRDEA